MVRPLETIKDINDSKSLWKVAVLVKDMWTVTNYKQTQYVEMVLTDKQGHDIQVIVPSTLTQHFKEVLAENNTFTLQNIEHKIHMPPYKFTEFSDIKQGKVRPDVVVDIIGVFHELDYTQTVAGNKKIQINFTLKDLKGDIIKCTLWGDFGLQFQNYNNTRSDWGPTVILIHNGKIKEATENYELGVSNAWNGTKLFINDDIAPINKFKKSLSADQQCSSQSLSLTCQTQMLSQSSSFSQMSGPEKFMQHASILPIYATRNNTTVCATVGHTVKLRPNPKGWYYKACCKCPKAAKGDTLPLRCPDSRETNAINLRTFAFRAKWQRSWDTFSVQALKEDGAIVKKIIELFPITTTTPSNDEGTSKLLITTTTPSNDEGTSKLLITTTTPSTHEIKDTVVVDNIVDVEIKDDVIYPTQDLSASSEYDPEAVSELTPYRGKRVSASSSHSQNSEQDDCPTQFSSTKMKKTIKIDKNPL
ncbi:hypothetical protein TSUD_287320 [Trifolium subterraneum]|uniref:Replication protein A 70 kDa DNA-binding subunit B/D first OB fold domain-containing protein n=1 Tax=Trifolium subterraneum TaxID=3900 RepID=A0A2Z6PH68_TRISU|nr:hypothetical protein TSUD_287320 [Trifolium subterraneum]